MLYRKVLQFSKLAHKSLGSPISLPSLFFLSLYFILYRHYLSLSRLSSPPPGSAQWQAERALGGAAPGGGRAAPLWCARAGAGVAAREWARLRLGARRGRSGGAGRGVVQAARRGSGRCGAGAEARAGGVRGVQAHWSSGAGCAEAGGGVEAAGAAGAGSSAGVSGATQEQEWSPGPGGAHGSGMCRCGATRPERTSVRQQEEEEELCRATTCRATMCSAWRCPRWASSGRDRVGVQEGRARCGRSCSAATAGESAREQWDRAWKTSEAVEEKETEGTALMKTDHGPRGGGGAVMTRRAGRRGGEVKAVTGCDELGGASCSQARRAPFIHAEVGTGAVRCGSDARRRTDGRLDSFPQARAYARQPTTRTQAGGRWCGSRAEAAHRRCNQARRSCRRLRGCADRVSAAHAREQRKLSP
jgi:hypothetical protein